MKGNTGGSWHQHREGGTGRVVSSDFIHTYQRTEAEELDVDEEIIAALNVDDATKDRLRQEFAKSREIKGKVGAVIARYSFQSERDYAEEYELKSQLAILLDIIAITI